MMRRTLLAALIAAGFASSAMAFPVINEVNYDNDGTDNTEYIEIYHQGGGDFSSIDLVLYNGNGGAEYSRTTLGTIPADGFLVIGAIGVPNLDIVLGSGGTNLIQNGAPDGMALVDTSLGTCLEFLSYEPSPFVATTGECTGVLSIDIGVEDLDPPGTATNPQDEVILQRFPNGNPSNTWLATSDGIDAGIFADGTPGTTNTPEPTTLALLGLGSLVFFRRRK